MEVFSSVDTIWVLLGAALVFFMQAGFAMVETGLTRAKNAGNIIMKNVMDFCCGTIVYWIFGFGLMFGASIYGFIGGGDLFIQGDYSSTFPTEAFVIFQTVFCATAATIVSGAMAESTKFSAYLLYSIVISALVYPISGHWIWGGGWLAQLGFHDFAGSTAVHMVGGVSALIGAAILGPRIGKYDKKGKPRAIPGHSLTLAALGVFILWFAWFGFNGCSTVSMTGDESIVSASSIFVTTNLAAAVATVGAMCITWIRYGKPDVSMTLNGALAGLVAITAGCDAVSPAGAALIGLIAAFIVVFGVEFVDKKLHIDDPVGAVAVHGFCGAAGTILTGLFSTSEGLFYTGDASFLGVQALGVAAVVGWVTVCMTAVFFILKKTIGLRVTKKEEIAGLDIEEHGLTAAYGGFAMVPDYAAEGAEDDLIAGTTDVVKPAASVERAVPVEHMPAEAPGASDVKMTKIAIVMPQSRFERLKKAMNDIGISGMTVTNVLGFGLQKGNPKYYRGVELEGTLLPKVKVEIIVCKVPVEEVIETARRVLYTGNIGDGKIFVYNVEDVVKVRTGSRGYDALQDED